MHGTYDEKLGMRDRAKYLLLWAIVLQILPPAVLIGYGAFAGHAKNDFDSVGIFLITFAFACGFGSLIFWCFGLAKYAESKGHGRAYGIFGIFGLFGLFLVAIKKDEFRLYVPSATDRSNYPRATHDWTTRDILR